MNQAKDAASLVRLALEARRRAYAPYSRFRVGAALLLADGEVVLGANVENASYGLTVCAERVAVQAAVASGKRKFAALAVASGPGASLCGACRQVLREFAPEIEIHLADETGRFRSVRLPDLLPDSFGPETLGGAEGDPPAPREGED